MIDAAKAKANPASKPLEAEKLFGAGGRFYLDYHVGRVLAMTTEMTAAQMPKEAQEAMKKMTAGLENLAPVSMAGFAEPTRYRATMLIPADLIGKMADNMRSMMPKPVPSGTQGMQGAPGMPGAPKPR